MRNLLIIFTFMISLVFSGSAVAGFSELGNTATAYTSTELNQIIESLGYYTLNPTRGPKGYYPLNDTATAWRPSEYHKIFTSYGLLMNKDGMAGKLGRVKYSKMVDGQVRFLPGNYAYTEYELARILTLYYKPASQIAAAAPPDTDGDGVTDDFDLCPGTPVGAKVNAEGCWVLQNKALFAFDSAVVNAQFLPDLDEVARVIHNNPYMIVDLQGHTDSVGSAAYNQKLSLRRAMAIKTILVNRNKIASSRITVIGYGESQPTATNTTAEGRALNRRVEIVPEW